MKNEYGTCVACNQPFNTGDDFIRIEAIRNYTSQGYPDQFRLAVLDYHIACFNIGSEAIVTRLVQQRSDIRLP
jgi:hypothetical protein